MESLVPWERIKLEYISTMVPMRTLARRYSLTDTNVFYQAKKDGWFQLRKEFIHKVIKKAEKKAENKAVNTLANCWVKQLKIYDKLDRQIERILEKYDMDGAELMNPNDIRTLSAALTETLKGQKLIRGEPTGEETNVSFSMRVVQFIKEREKEVEKQNVTDVDG